MFSTQSENCTLFAHIFDTITLFAAKLEEPKIGICGKRLKIIGNGGTKACRSCTNSCKGTLVNRRKLCFQQSDRELRSLQMLFLSFSVVKGLVIMI